MPHYRQYKNRPEFFRITDDPHPLKRGLVFAGLGREHKSTHYRDSSGRGNHGTLTNGPTWAFDATLGRWCTNHVGTSSQYISVNSFAIPGDFTVSAWVYATATTRYGIFCGQGNTSEGFQFEWCHNGTGELSYYSTSTGWKDTTAGTASAGVWTHVATVNDNDVGLTHYINGIAYAFSDATSAPGSQPLSWYIGRDYGGSYFDGKISDVMAWSGVLQPKSIISQLADPSNAMLSGLILPPRRRWWPVAGTTPAVTYKPMQFQVC